MALMRMQFHRIFATGLHYYKLRLHYNTKTSLLQITASLYIHYYWYKLRLHYVYLRYYNTRLWQVAERASARRLAGALPCGAAGGRGTEGHLQPAAEQQLLLAAHHSMACHGWVARRVCVKCTLVEHSVITTA